jgi:hypothetical protein
VLIKTTIDEKGGLRLIFPFVLGFKSPTFIYRTPHGFGDCVGCLCFMKAFGDYSRFKKDFAVHDFYCFTSATGCQSLANLFFRMLKNLKFGLKGMSCF